jgi:Bifunctional DNA primase/polymerase, N-terminal/Primase C terminal 1 (PriCT-1)
MAEAETAPDLLAAALEFVGRGLPVFPLRPRSKVPATVDGFKAATLDAGQVAEWWERWPDANIGVPTGPVSGFVVLDVDERHGGLASFEKLRRQLPRTAQVLTGSGGFHYWFRQVGEVRNSAGLLGDGLDVRGIGGYVVAPPSVHESGNLYKWLRGLEEAADWPADLSKQARKRRNGTAEKALEIIPEGQRRAALLSVAGKLKRSGLSGEEILPSLRELNKRCRPPLDENELVTIASPSTIEAVERLGKPEYTGPTRELDFVVERFRSWLHMPDPGALYVVLAAAVANRLPGDPLWLLLVAASGAGKTELLASFAGLDEVVQAAVLTEASLLSGTSQREKASTAKGGLLREVGDYGIVVLKDFGSVLSMHRDARASVLAALREIYDGSWTRHVGTDGGRSLHWDGKLGLIAGCTPTVDRHQAVMAALGERFAMYRLELDERGEQGRRSLSHLRRERGMRAELRDAITGFLAGLTLPTDPPHLDEPTIERLVALANLASRSRSAVERDGYSREIELVPDAEAPGRLVVVLANLLDSLRVIGAPDPWRLVVKVGLDSMPAQRRRILEHTLTVDVATTKTAATTLGLPTATVRRVLEDLAAHDVLHRQDGGDGKADEWRMTEWAREDYAAATGKP